MDKFTVTIKNPETGQENSLTIVEHVPTKGRGKDIPRFQIEGISGKKGNDLLTLLVNIWGADKVAQVFVKPRLNQLFSVLTEEATTKERKEVDGKEVVVKETDEGIIKRDFQEMLAVLSSRGETLAALNARLAEIQDEEMPAVLALFDTDTDPAEIKRQADAIREELKEVRQSIASKKAERAQKKENSPAEATA